MKDEGEQELVKTEKEIASFYSGTKIILPSLLTLIITGIGWYLTAQQSAVEKGEFIQRVQQLEVRAARSLGRYDALNEKVNGHDVALGRIEVQLTNVEKVSNETYVLLRDFTRQR